MMDSPFLCLSDLPFFLSPCFPLLLFCSSPQDRMARFFSWKRRPLSETFLVAFNEDPFFLPSLPPSFQPFFRRFSSVFTSCRLHRLLESSLASRPFSLFTPTGKTPMVEASFGPFPSFFRRHPFGGLCVRRDPDSFCGGTP